MDQTELGWTALIGLDCIRLDRTGLDWIEEQTWTGLDWTGLDWTGPDWTGLDWTGLDWTGLDWTGLDWTKRDWTELNWTELDWTGWYCMGLDWLEIITGNGKIRFCSSAFEMLIYANRN